MVYLNNHGTGSGVRLKARQFTQTAINDAIRKTMNEVLILANSITTPYPVASKLTEALYQEITNDTNDYRDVTVSAIVSELKEGESLLINATLRSYESGDYSRFCTDVIQRILFSLCRTDACAQLADAAQYDTGSLPAYTQRAIDEIGFAELMMLYRMGVAADKNTFINHAIEDMDDHNLRLIHGCVDSDHYTLLQVQRLNARAPWLFNSLLRAKLHRRTQV